MDLKIETDNKQTMKNVIEQMEQKDADVIFGKTPDGELMMIQLVEGHERHKLKTVVIQDNGVNHVSYIGENGELIEEYYEKEKLPDLIDEVTGDKEKIYFELGAVFEIGRLLQDYPEIFPSDFETE